MFGLSDQELLIVFEVMFLVLEVRHIDTPINSRKNARQALSVEKEETYQCAPVSLHSLQTWHCDVNLRCFSSGLLLG